MKKLKNVNAVQPLSRLNRICPLFEKKTFILDFINSYEDIINAYAILDSEDIEKVNNILYKYKVTSLEKKKINFYLDKAQKLIENYSNEKQHEFVIDL